MSRSPSSAMRHWAAAAAASAVVLVAIDAAARPGGGHSFSGGGSSGGGSGGGGSGGGAAIAELLMLCIRYPYIGIPLVVIIGLVALAARKSRARDAGGNWQTGAPAAHASSPSVKRASAPRAYLAGLRGDDPDFSIAIFEDFLYALYARAHEARGKGGLDALAPYMNAQARTALGMYRAAAVKDVIIGSMQLVSAGDRPQGGQTFARVHVKFESCLTEIDDRGRPQGVFVVERWTLVRWRRAKSRPPDKATIFGCPNCGAPLEAVRGETCSYCKQKVAGGGFDWTVVDVHVDDRQKRAPALTADVAETGTDLPTIVDPGARGRFDLVAHKDPHFSWERFQGRLALVFARLQVAWSTRDWLKARPFVTDNLFQMQLYFVQSYVAAGLYNKTDGARITRVECANVVSDKYYDAITVRVFATGLDYTVDEKERVVSGSKSRERPYSEYWTLVRGASVSRPSTTTPECPNCGAPLEGPPGDEAVGVGMTGNCRHCRAKVTSGAFDWVLSRIEQDEAYLG